MKNWSREILNKLQTAVYMTDKDMNLVYLNAAAEEISGYTMGEALHKKCWDVFGTQEKNCREHCPVKTAINEGAQKVSHHSTILNRAGKRYHMVVSVTPFAHGNQRGAMFELEKLSGSSLVELSHIKALDALEIEVERRRAVEAELLREKQLFMAGPVVMFQWLNAPGWPVEWVSANIGQLGYTSGDFSAGSKVFSDIIHEDDLVRIHSEVEQYSKEGRDSFEQEYRIRTKEGCIIWVHDFTRVIRDSSGAVTHYDGYLRDISNRKKSCAELSQSRDMLNMLIDTVPLSIFWKDGQGRYLGCNRVFAGIAGLEDPEQVVGLTDYELPWDREDIAKYLQHDQDVLEGKSVKRHILESVRHADGRQIWIEGSVAPLFDENGNAFGLMGIFEDITARRSLEEALEKRIIALTRPLESSKEIEFEDLFNIDDIQKLQDEFAKATGVATLITHPDGSPITQPGNFTRFCTEIARQSQLGEVRCRQSDAETGKMSIEGPIVQPCQGAGFLNAGAAIVVEGKHLASWLIGQVRDEDQTEEQIREYARQIGEDEELAAAIFNDVPCMSREQFGHVSRVLCTMANYLSTLAYQNIQQAKLIRDLNTSEKEQKLLQSQLLQAQRMESVGRLAGGIAHDFNNMLSVIYGNAELMIEDIEPGSILTESLEEILKASENSINLTRQLLAFARKQAIAPKVLDLNEVIEGMLRMVGRLIGEDIDLVWRPCFSLWQVKVDPSQIDQILANLCTNARDAIQGIGRIVIKTANVFLDTDYCTLHKGGKPGEYVCISVHDTGCGMDAHVLDNLFDPFFTTKEVGKGTGLGLSTVYGIVQQNKGHIEVRSEPGQGCTVSIYLPRHIDAGQLQQRTLEIGSMHTGTETILLVEDEPGVLRMTSTMLQQLGYTVLEASGPEQAVERVASYGGRIDLLVSDVVMPGMSGRDMTEMLLQSSPQLKVLFISGYSDEVVAPHGILEPGIHFMSKPFSRQSFSQKIREILG
nr:PocR ligand-binding domain-containing protein [Desulfogranum japonicum]